MNTLDMIQSNPHAITEELLTAQAEQLTAAQEAASTAFAAYNDDLDTRRQTLEQQANQYSIQIRDLQSRSADLSAQVKELSSRGEIDAAADVDAQLEVVEREISTLERKKRLACAVDLKGDSKLYQAAKEAMDSLTREYERYDDLMGQIRATALAERERLGKLADEAAWKMRYQSQCLGQKTKAFEKVERHFHELDRIEKEARERHTEERKRQEAEASAKRNVRVIVPHD